MDKYSTRPFDLVCNTQYEFQKLYVDGVCQLDSFIDFINNHSDKRFRNYLASIIHYMDNFSDHCLLPKEKFRPIYETGRPDVFEFKREKIRIYVIKQKPNIFVVLGGLKVNQDKDIAKIKRLLSEFPIQTI